MNMAKIFSSRTRQTSFINIYSNVQQTGNCVSR